MLLDYGKYSPLAKPGGIPDYKRDSSKWFDWVDEQERICLEGYQVGGDLLPGRLYFKLNFFHLLHLGQDDYETLIKPYYVDVQREFYELLDHNIKVTGRDILVGKGRDKGFSYDIAAISLYETHFHDYTSVLGLFPSGKSKAKAKFKEKYDIAWNNLLDEFKLYPDLQDSKDIYKYGWQETNPETGQKQDVGNMSSLTMIEAVNADVAKSGRYKWIFMEEFGELKNPLDIIITNRANARKGAKKYGITIAGGTSNAFNEGYKDFRELWYNHDNYGFDKFFIPAQKAYWGYVNYQTGKSDEEGALAHIMEGRKGLKGKKLTIELQNYPTTEKEMFISIQQSPYPAELINEQQDLVLRDKEISNAIQIGNLYPKFNVETGQTTVEFHQSPNGKFKIFKHPVKGQRYPDVGGVDSYRLAQVEESDSKGAIVIYRPFQGVNEIGNLPVCIYHHRPDNKEEFFNDVLMCAKYYNCKMLVEYTDEDILTYFKTQKALHLLKERPKLIKTDRTKATYTFGIKPTEHNISVATEYSVTEFSNNHENYVFIDLLDEMAIFGTKNTDIMSAYQWAVLHAMDNVKPVVEEKKKKRKKFAPYCTLNANGDLVVVNSKEASMYLNDEDE